MRGSVYYQSAQLVKIIFQEGTKKDDRLNPTHPHYQKVASYKTMESYRNIWNNFFNYLKEHWKIKDFTKIESIHVASYIEYKIEYYPSRLYLNKIISAIGKLEIALVKYAVEHNLNRSYNFSIREKIKKSAVDLELVANNYHNRAYSKPLEIIALLQPEHSIAAMIQYEGGARLEAVSLIKQTQLKGRKKDNITKTEKAVLWTKEKGGKEGEVFVSIDTYKKLEQIIHINKIFKINKNNYLDDIKKTCIGLEVPTDGSHGFRWNFAQRRLFEYAQADYSYEESLLGVSKEMKHNRASITMHYLG